MERQQPGYRLVGRIAMGTHHVGSLVACLTGWLVFRSLRPDTPRTQRLVISLITALCLVSAAGMSIYVTLVFAFFWAVWWLVTL